MYFYDFLLFYFFLTKFYLWIYCCRLILKTDWLTLHTIPPGEPFLPLHPRRGTQAQGCSPNVSTETVIEARSSLPSSAGFVERSDFCSATPRATVGRAGVIKVGEQNRMQTKEREREREAEKKSCMVKSAPRLVSLATPSLCSPFVPINNSLQTALTSKWLVVDLRSGPWFRDRFLDLQMRLFWLSSEDLLQTGTEWPRFYKFLQTGTFILLHLL